MHQGIKETVEIMVSEFVTEIENTEPFETNLINFSMKLKAKLLELANLSIYDKEAVEHSLILAVQGIEDSIDKFLKDIDTENAKLLERAIRLIEEINKILKEINELGYVSDREILCRVSSKFDDHILTVNGKLKNNSKGILGFLSKLFK